MKKIISLSIAGVLLLCVLSASATIGERNKIHTQINEKEIQSSSTYEDELDQYQIEQAGASGLLPVGALPIPLEPPININFQVAQSFIPTKEVLTRTELLVGRNTTASHPYVLAIREELTENNLVETSVNPDQFPIENFSWLEFDFEDIWVTVGQTYYIVCYTENITDNWYAWAMNNDSESYENGCAWISIDDGDTWGNDSLSDENNMIKKQTSVAPLMEEGNFTDMCFKTYGLDETELEIEITKTGINFGAILTNIGDAIAWDVELTVTIQGGLFGLINTTITGTYTELGINDSISILIGFLFGLGPVTITVTVKAANVQEVSKSIEGFLFLIFFIF